MSLYNAFAESKRYAMYELRRAPDSLFAALPWLEKHLDDTNDIMGADPFIYGMGTQNRITVETLEQYAFEQGLTPRQLTVEELFAPETYGATSN
jgi:4,5-dihydroxyphthalate decarboxylase